MPIRINLLAEQIAAEEERRKDPVKRAIFAGILLVIAVLAWSGWIQLQIMKTSSEKLRVESEWKAKTNAASVVQSNKALGDVAVARLASLNRLATNRYLWGSTLQALHTLPAGSSIVLVRLNGAVGFVATNEQSRVGTKTLNTPGAVESIVLTLAARDYGRPEDNNIARFQQTLATNGFFREHLAPDGINMVQMGQPEVDPDEPTKSFVSFSLACRYIEKLRKRE